MTLIQSKAQSTRNPFAGTANLWFLFGMLLFAVPFHPASAQATAPPLGAAQSFAVVGASTVTNTGSTIVTGNLGVSPGTAITGFPPGIVVGGTRHAADSMAGQAQSDAGSAFVDLAGQSCKDDLTGRNLGGLTLVPGVYCFSSSAELTGTLTLNGEGNAAAVWVFQIGTTLVTASNASVLLINGAQQCNVFWQVGSSATLGTGTSFIGDIIALESVTLTTNATVSGRALARNGAVTMDSNTVSLAACALPPVAPVLNKSFDAATITAGGVSILTITLSNPGSSSATLSSPLTDALPTGLTVSGSGSTTCTNGAVNAATGGSTVSLTEGTIPASGSCTVTVPVTALAGGNYVNSLEAGVLETSNGSNAAPAIATLTVNSAANALPTLVKAFSPATIFAGGVSTLTITLSNTDAKAAALTVPLTDTLPSGVTVSSGGSTTCGGMVTAAKGSSSVTLTGGSIPAHGSCQVTVVVIAPAAGNYFNSLAAGVLKTSTGSNASPAIATLTVTPVTHAPPTLSKAFSPASIPAGGVSTLTITLSNTDTAKANLTAPLTDTLPAHMTVDGSGTTTCGGTVTLTGGSIPAKGTCTVKVPITASQQEACFNLLPVGALKTSNGANPAAATATLTVTPPVLTTPTFTKSYNPNTIKDGGTSLLTIILSNATSTVDKITAPFIDTFPAGEFVAGAATNTCGGKSTATMGGSTLTLTGGSIPAHGTCSLSVEVTAKTSGSYNNYLAPCSLHTNQGCNLNSYIGVLTVGVRLDKIFAPATIPVGGTSLLTIRLVNPATTAATLTAPFVDNFPSGLLVSGGAKTTCKGTLSAASGTSKVTLNGGSIPAGGSCLITVNVTSNTADCYYNTLPAGALHTSNGNNTTPYTASVMVY
jgi:uncharacterized repeat protein (TIGR01451 family)